MTRPDDDPIGHDEQERDPEAPVADAAEQSVSAGPDDEEPTEVQRGIEVSEWDAVEQSIVVNLEDDYDR